MLALGLLGTAATSLPVSASDDCDLLIAGGRVVDPETGLDDVRYVAVGGDKILAVSETPVACTRTIDASGRVVAPGFVDMHAHGQDILAARVQALDGVTTALELEAGVLPLDDYYNRLAEEGRPINYGASVNWANARIATFAGEEPQASLEWFLEAFARTDWQNQVATPTQQEQILAQVKEGLDQGGLGIGILIGYAPGTGHKEFFDLHRIAADRGVPTFTHARYLSMLEPKSSFEGMTEIVAAAAGTGAHAHIVHLNSISLRDIGTIAPMIREAQQQGLPITTEAYPYGAGSTGIGAAMFRGERWRERLGGVTAANFDVDGKRLTEEELARLQAEAPGTDSVIHFLELDDPKDRAFLDQSVLMPGGVIASDGGNWLIDGEPVPQDTWPLPDNAWSHPRSAGTFARFLGQYVRERNSVSLLEGIRRVSFGPVQILEKAVPQLRTKGRIQPGMGADIVVFDLATVSDQATFEAPARPSQGFDYVIVNGVVLVDGGVVDTSVLPGRAIRNAVTASNEAGR